MKTTVYSGYTFTMDVIGYLAAESAGVCSVLRDLVLLHHFTESGTITGTVLTTDSGFLCALALTPILLNHWPTSFTAEC